MGKRITIMLLALCLCAIAHAKDRRFPPQVLSAKTLAVIAHYGFTPASSDLAREAKIKGEAEQVLQNWGRYELRQDPDQADIVLLVFAGFGFGDTAGAAVFPGGKQPWMPMPLWIGEEITTLLNRSAPAAVTKRFRDDVNAAEDKKSVEEGGKKEERQGDKQEAGPTGAAEPEPGSAGWLPREILKAKTVASIYRGASDRVPAVKGEEPDRDVVDVLQKWGRYTVVEDPSKADLVMVTVSLLPGTKFFGGRQNARYRSVFIFQGGTRPDWSKMPLWAAMEQQGFTSASAGLVKRLRKQVESAETPAPKETPATGNKEPSGS